MLKIFDVGEQKKLNKRILVMVIISFFVMAFAIIIPVTDLGQGKMYDFIGTIDDELTVAVYA